MKYNEAEEYLYQLNKRGIKPGLEGINLLLSALSNPEKDLKVIHVVGTNGKGSVSAFLAKILRASGLKVGLYSSPQVFCDREIIKVNGRNVSKEDYVSLVEAVSEKNTFCCTRFEVETAMALLHFKNVGCDIVILEAGMGGLLDATNVCAKDLMTVFTSIGIDHTAYLGDTVSKIAKNKAGILKENTLAVSAPQSGEVFDTLAKACKEKNVDFVMLDKSEIKGVKFKADETCFDYKGLKKLSIHMLGAYQPVNAALSAEAAYALSKRGIKVSEAAVRKGLSECFLEGRFECVSRKPLVYLDGAHNEPASLVLRETLLSCFTKKKFVYIMGMLKDKDVETVVRNTVDLASFVFTVATPNRDRTMSAFELADIVRKYNMTVTSMDGVEEAVELAMEMADKDTVIVVFGSLSHLSKAKGAVAECLKGRKGHSVKV